MLIAAFCLFGLLGRLVVTVLPAPSTAWVGSLTGTICHTATSDSDDPGDRPAPLGSDTCPMHACCHVVPQAGLVATSAGSPPLPQVWVVATVSFRPPATGPPAVPPLPFHSRAPPIRS
ncbi:MAG: hypothetical protein AB7O80_13615 [Acetobacteraceae bacterium]